MIRRGLERGFLPAWALGLGACSGDFLWALAVSLGAGALVQVPGVRATLGVVSIALLLFLAWTFGRGAWQAWQRASRPAAVAGATPARRFDSTRGGYVLGLSLALSSPWNIAFWLAVIGSQAGGARLGAYDFLTVAIGVFLAAGGWSLFFCTAVSAGARFATPAWFIVTNGATAALMLYFAVQTARRMALGV
jgi:threonine/homoserine/homoserine lactone efflux protein